ncbi:LuxR C-terminal-related transcriptional regulator [Aquincola tertiaricarbonis]|uniref:LuxR C-terminal-related transcriptional regulator n=1 Tax=Aquincola tertiaricarbonis TaxID=391953 RepID=A0ABY4S6K7_AQUTE|nr:LuxR family transcriptional regulator [Aquincola tertiaricarbonis]URI06935.1 LuxR C-terminal-related transcriptional regulator [Aquincola tertiaricarbonis]
MLLKHYFDVSQAEDIDTFRRRLIDMAGALDFPLITSVLVVEDQHAGRHQLHEVGNIPEAFANASRAPESVARDPVIKRLRTLSVPFAYDQSLYVEEKAGDLWEEQAPYGYHSGISMALHLPDGKHFFLGVDRDHALPADEGLSRTMADLQLLAVHAQSAAARLLLPKAEPVEPPPRLSPREIEVLRWAMDGKSNWNIAQILNVSEHTVSFHLRNAFAKLKASTRTQAVLKAKTLDLL